MRGYFYIQITKTSFMKKVFLAVSCLLLFSITWAQSEEAKDEKPQFMPSTAIKWNPSSLYFGKIGLQGEYNFKRKKSITFAVGIPMSKATSVEMDDEDRDVEMKTFSVMGGYRMYLGKKTMTGVYFEPYLKYVKNDAATLIDTDLGGEPAIFATTSKYSGFGVGAQLGVQFMIAKRVVFDFFFLGPEANSVKHTVIMRDINSAGSWDVQEAADAENEINESIGDLPVIGNKIKVAVDAANKTVSSEYKGFLPGIRFGLSVGVRF
jgi:hypothetical protein